MVRTIYAEELTACLPRARILANAKNNTYGWMTVHKFTPDRPVTYPFKNFDSLR